MRRVRQISLQVLLSHIILYDFLFSKHKFSKQTRLVLTSATPSLSYKTNIFPFCATHDARSILTSIQNQ